MSDKKKAVDVWLHGKPATVRFIIAELRSDGTVRLSASSDQYGDEGPAVHGDTHADALDLLEKALERV